MQRNDRIKEIASELGIEAWRLAATVEQSLIETSIIKTATAAYNLLKKIGKAKQEEFWVIILNGSHIPVKTVRVTVGLLNRTMAHPREVFRPAIAANAAAVILAHNHPSGRAEPSQEDKDLTKRMVQAGMLLGISVLDHVIITEKCGYYSFAETGLMI